MTIEGVIVARIVDEMTYSVEDRGGKDVCITREGFAYETNDAPFLQIMKGAPEFMYNHPKQYTFISMNTCLDVIAMQPPRFDIVPLL
jgi:hypothetical protein